MKLLVIYIAALLIKTLVVIAGEGALHNKGLDAQDFGLTENRRRGRRWKINKASVRNQR